MQFIIIAAIVAPFTIWFAEPKPINPVQPAISPSIVLTNDLKVVDQPIYKVTVE